MYACLCVGQRQQREPPRPSAYTAVPNRLDMESITRDVGHLLSSRPADYTADEVISMPPGGSDADAEAARDPLPPRDVLQSIARHGAALTGRSPSERVVEWPRVSAGSLLTPVRTRGP